MKIKDMAQTVILICCLMVIPVFSFAYFLYVNTGLKLNEVFDKSFSAAFGFFGGAATLAAAYIASRLFNDWREIKQYEIILEYIMTIKSNVQEYFVFINTNRDSYLEYMHKLKQSNLTIEEYKNIALSIGFLERQIVHLLNKIILDVNELYYLKNKKPSDPLTNELFQKIFDLKDMGIKEINYHFIYENRITDTSLEQYYNYLVNDLTAFVYDKIMAQYLDDLILDAK